jgi:protein-L-isoaspartate(D-aspartate) O-methyltransferase
MPTEALPSGAQLRLNMVNGQLRTSDVIDAEVLAAFLAVEREKFVAPAQARLAYVDVDIPATGPSGRRLLAPRTLGLLLQAATVSPGDRTLDIGGGSGYGAAILAAMGASVVALETETEAARAALAGVAGIEIVEGGLAEGAPAGAPNHIIVIHGAFQTIPETLLAQLGKNGRLVAVDARRGGMRGVVLEKAATGYGERSLFDVKADVLPGLERAASFAF